MEKQFKTECGCPVTMLAADLENTGVWKHSGIIHHPKWGDIPARWSGDLKYLLEGSHEYDLIEYDPREDWPMDHPIWVRDCDNTPWSPRHFAGIGEDGKVRTWRFGHTNHTAVFVHQSAKAQESWNQATDIDPNTGGNR